MSADGTRQNVLASGLLSNWAPTWSPDGSRVFFLSSPSGQPDLSFVAVQDGKPQGKPQVVKSELGDAIPIGFSRSGLYYVSNRSEQDIFAVDLDPVTGKSHGPAVRLSQSLFGRNERAVWSPDKKWIAFHSRRGQARYGPGATVLVVRSMETGEEKAYPASFNLGQRPVWFQSGSAILEATRDVQGATSFRKIDFRTGKFELLPSPAAGLNPIFSLAADDKTVYAPVCDQGAGRCGVIRFDLASGQQTQVYSASDRSIVTGLALSPDGKTLALMVNDPPGEHRRQSVAIVGTDGSAFRRLVESTEALVPAVGLAWSPDSRWAYYVKVKEPESELWRVSASGEDEYTGFAAKVLKHINMSDDGLRLAFTAGQRANPELWVLDHVLPTPPASR